MNYPEQPPEEQEPHSARSHIRGSTLLLSGRVIALVMNLAVQVLTVRYLSKLDYGAFAYALALVSLGTSLALFGQDKAASRFLPIYQEQGRYDKLFGTVILIVATTAALGLAIIVGTFALSGFIQTSVVSNELSVALLLLLIALVPIEAYDAFLVSMFAALANPWAIFFRRYFLGPALKLIAVIVTMVVDGNVYLLATAYLIAGLVAVVINTAMLLLIMWREGLLRRFTLRTLEFPFREIYAFAIPLLSSDIAFLLRGSLAVVVLESFSSTAAVAEFRAVLPVARLNQAVLVSFSFLFVPVASRMFARNDREQISDLYWQTTSWVAALTLPLFLVCFSLAKPLTVVLFGTRYAESANVLALLSVGYFVHAVLGFAGRTLRVYNRIAYIVISDIIATVVAALLYWLLIPSYGALGAALAACAAMIIHALVNQGFLLAATGISLFRRRYARLYLLVACSALLVHQLQIGLSLGIATGIPLALAIWLLFLVANRRLLDGENTFPELVRSPLSRRLLVPTKRIARSRDDS